MATPGEDFAERLAQIRGRLDHPPDVRLGVLRLPLLDPLLDELESGAGPPPPARSAQVDFELERLAELLTQGMLGTASESVGRRLRIVELIRLADGGRVPALAADDQDPFGLDLRTMLESDDHLRASLGRIHPLLARVTSVLPSAAWQRDARALATSTDGPALIAATSRILASLLRAPISSRPDLLIGGVRPINQRLARGLLWYASVSFDTPAELLGAIGLRMGTSGRSDAVVRDAALANTSAALLGASADPSAAAALASMRSQVSNRVVLKQVDRALMEIASRVGTSVEEVIDLSLPAFGLDERGRFEVDVGPARALVAITPEAEVAVRWLLADGSEVGAVPDWLATAEPAAVADVTRRAAMIKTALVEERGRLEDRLGSRRSWPEPVWRRRFIDHPVAGSIGRRLVWTFDRTGGDSIGVLAAGSGLVGIDEHPITPTVESTAVRLWHPAEAGRAAVAAWRATLASRAARQPFPQVDRQVFERDPAAASPVADLRFAGRIVDHGRLRALLRNRGWAVPSLGPWDQGAEATSWRAFDDGLRAELRYQAVDRVATGDRVERALIVAVRFVRTDAPPTNRAGDVAHIALEEVPPRSLSEALRDASLVVVVAELPGAS